MGLTHEPSSEPHLGHVEAVQRFRGGLVFKAHRLLYHSTLGSRVIKKKKDLGHFVDGDVGDVDRVAELGILLLKRLLLGLDMFRC